MTAGDDRGSIKVMSDAELIETLTRFHRDVVSPEIERNTKQILEHTALEFERNTKQILEHTALEFDTIRDLITQRSSAIPNGLITWGIIAK